MIDRNEKRELLTDARDKLIFALDDVLLDDWEVHFDEGASVILIELEPRDARRLAEELIKGGDGGAPE